MLHFQNSFFFNTHIFRKLEQMRKSIRDFVSCFSSSPIKQDTDDCNVTFCATRDLLIGCFCSENANTEGLCLERLHRGQVTVTGETEASESGGCC